MKKKTEKVMEEEKIEFLEKVVKVLDMYNLIVAAENSIILALKIKRNKEITKLDVINMFLAGITFGKYIRR